MILSLRNLEYPFIRYKINLTLELWVVLVVVNGGNAVRVGIRLGIVPTVGSNWDEVITVVEVVDKVEVVDLIGIFYQTHYL